MKKIVLFTLALAFAATSVNAQSRWFVSGSLGVDYSKTKDLEATTTFSITPSVHYMFNENWAVGLGLGYAYTQAPIDETATPTLNTNEFSIVPSLTYFMKLGDKFYYTPELSINYTYSTTKSKGVTPATESNSGTFGAAIAPLSFEFRPVDCIGLNMSAGSLGFNSENPDGGPTNSKLFLNLNTGINFSFRFYF